MWNFLNQAGITWLDLSLCLTTGRTTPVSKNTPVQGVNNVPSSNYDIYGTAELSLIFDLLRSPGLFILW